MSPEDIKAAEASILARLAHMDAPPAPEEEQMAVLDPETFVQLSSAKRVGMGAAQQMVHLHPPAQSSWEEFADWKHQPLFAPGWANASNGDYQGYLLAA